ILLALLVFLGVFVLGVRIEMSAGEDDLLAVGPEVAARRLADAGADATKPASLKVHHEDLIKRIARILFLGLKTNLLTVGREISFAGASKFLGDLANVPQMRRFGLFPFGRVKR